MKSKATWFILLILLAAFTSQAQKPLYTFTFKVYINESTAQYYGGHAAIENLIGNQFADVNQFYNNETGFTGSYQFVPASFSYFTETGANQHVMDSLANQAPETAYDFRVLYSRSPYPPDPNGNQNILSDYEVHTRSIRFALNAEAEWQQSLFGPIPTRILCHEIGHSRGAADLYSVNLAANNNQLYPDVSYTYPVASIMNYLYDLNAGWDPHSIACINASGGTILTEASWQTLFWSLFPSNISIRLRNSQGDPLTNAKVTLYGIRWLSNALNTSDAFVYYTDAQGNVSFDLSNTANNPFIQNGAFALFSNFLVVAEYQGQGAYNWIPIFDVQTAKINGQNEYLLDYAFNTSPVVSISSPLDNAVFIAPSNITISAIASDSGGLVSKVDFYSGTTLLGTDVSAPYSFAWNDVTDGFYDITAVATDTNGISTTSAPVSITVNVNQPSVIDITSPVAGSTYTGNSVTIDVTASDPDGSITLVEYYDGSILLGSSTAEPYEFIWNNPPAG
ncbi:MAG: Ig-like domain-containing protein, partial [Cytophagaceae bacterium]